MTVITTIGKIIRDFELKISSKKIPYVNFKLMVSRRYDKKPLYYDCTAFGHIAEWLVSAKAKAGSSIHVTGAFDVEDFEYEGEKRYSLKLVVHDWGYTPSTGGNGSGGGKNGGNAEGNANLNHVPTHGQANEEYFCAEENLDDEDLPF